MDLRNVCDDFLQIAAVDIPHRRQIKRFRLVKAAETGAVPAFNGGSSVQFLQIFQFMEKVFFGRVRRVGSDDETVLSVRILPLVLQPFGCERRLFFRKFCGKPDFFISCCEGKIFSGEI